MKIKKTYRKNENGEMEVVSVEQLPDRPTSTPTIESLQNKIENLELQITDFKSQLEILSGNTDDNLGL